MLQVAAGVSKPEARSAHTDPAIKQAADLGLETMVDTCGNRPRARGGSWFKQNVKTVQSGVRFSSTFYTRRL